MPRVLILGTGTGVGKTHFTAALARALRTANPTAHVLAVKPIETGVPGLRSAVPRAGTDAAMLEAASNAAPLRPHPLYAFREPVSAHLAASRAHEQISPQRVAAWLQKLAIPHTTPRVTSWLLVETAGGVFSPITRTLTNNDLCRQLAPDFRILVAPDSLGVLHDVRATLLALGTELPDFLVLSAARPKDASAGTNARELPRIGLPRPIAVLPRSSAPDPALRPLVRALTRATVR